MNSNIFDVSNEVVVVTGGSGQLGFQYISLFLKNKSKVVSIDKYESEEIKKLKNKFASSFLSFTCDITIKKSVISVSKEINNKFGPVTVLVNNAAIDSPPNSSGSETGPFESYPEKSWDNVMNVNLKGVFNLCQVFGEKMAANKKGSIINISSIYGLVSPDQSIYEYKRKNGEVFYKPIAYSVSKSGLRNMTKYLAVYWAKKNVRVNCLILAGVENNQDIEFKKAYNSRIPIGRMANEKEYNGALIFLSSSASNYMTGSELVIDGGWTAI